MNSLNINENFLLCSLTVQFPVFVSFLHCCWDEHEREIESRVFGQFLELEYLPSNQTPKCPKLVVEYKRSSKYSMKAGML